MGNASRHRVADTAYGANSHWKRKIDELERALNGAQLSSKYLPVGIADIRSISSTMALPIGAKVASDYINRLAAERESEIGSRLFDLERQIFRQLQEGQAVVVGIEIHRMPSVSVTITEIRPLSLEPSLRPGLPSRPGADDTLVPDGAGKDVHRMSLTVRKPFHLDGEQTSLSEFAPNQRITTDFRVMEVNDAVEVRQLRIPEGYLKPTDSTRAGPDFESMIDRSGPERRRAVAERLEREAKAHQASEAARMCLVPQTENTPSIEFKKP